MRIVRAIGLFICSSLLRFTLFFGIGLLCVVISFGSGSEIKEALTQKNVYSEFVGSVIDDTAKSQTESSLPLNDPGIRKVINESFPPQLLQKNTETVVDAAYTWLEGKTDQPKFTVDFTKARQKVSDDLAAFAFNRLATKPVCFAVPEELDPFTAGCQPPNTNLAQEQQKLSQAIAGEGGILPKVVFTAADLPKDSSGKTITQKYSFAPTVFIWAKRSPIILVGVLLLASAGVVLLNQSKRRGFQQLGYSLIGSGTALLITPFLIIYVLPRFGKSLQFNQSTRGSSAQELINSVTNQLNQDFNNLLINITLQVIVVGVVILVAERFTRPSSVYLQLEKKSGVVSSYKRKPSDTKRKMKPEQIPVQSSEESERRKPKRTKNKKYRKIPRKEI